MNSKNSSEQFLRFPDRESEEKVLSMLQKSLRSILTLFDVNITNGDEIPVRHIFPSSEIRTGIPLIF